LRGRTNALTLGGQKKGPKALGGEGVQTNVQQPTAAISLEQGTR